MRVVALISGGKDSCYNMMQCVASGHTIVALANLQPIHADEQDSYMYQSVGHQGVELYAEAMDLPLYRQKTEGVAQDKSKDYTPTESDEVEDLYLLLNRIKSEMDIEAVSVGAILSDYQRIRVENVCSRLGLVSLAYLWRRNQAELLQEMIASQLEAIIIKVAALGLEPKKHLGLSLPAARPHLLLMHDKYGLNVCGEGGEYETFTLDCPLFRRKLVVEEKELVIHSADPVAPVGYLNLKLRLADKTETVDCLTLPATVKNSFDFVSDLNDSVYSDASDVELSETELDSIERLEKDGTHTEEVGVLLLAYENENEKRCVSRSSSIDIPPERKRPRTESESTAYSPPKTHVFEERDDIPDHGCVHGNTNGWCFVGGVVGFGERPEEYATDAIQKLSNLISSEDLQATDVVSINLYIRDMSDYATINKVYSEYFNRANPPTRVCVQCPLPPRVGVIIDSVAHKAVKCEPEAEPVERLTMHVQSVSHWAPANIGPYSQAITVGGMISTCGQIALVPGAMSLVAGGARRQSTLALRHVSRLLRAARARSHIRSVMQCACYVTGGAGVGEARVQLERRTAGALAEYAVVGALPRGAAVEWHAWAHAGNHRFDYEETGCTVGEYKVAICRRWNYENTVAAFVCYVATGSSPSTCQLSFASEEACVQHRTLASGITEEEIAEIVEYSVKKLLGDATDRAPAIALRIFYKVSSTPAPAAMLSALGRARARLPARLAATLVPVHALHSAPVFLSLSGALLAE